MTYIEHKPIFPLSHWIEKLWYCSAADFTAVHLTIPLLYHELVFNFSDTYCVRKANETAYTLENPLAWINGLQSKAYFSYSSGKHEMIGILFKPNGLKVFCNYYSAEFVDEFTDATLIFGSPLHTVIDKLQNTPSMFDKFALIERFLLKKMIHVETPTYLMYSMQQLPETFGERGYVDNVCKNINISNKSLIKAFNKHVGINPIKFSHLQVINNAIMLLSKDPKQSLTALAYQLKFFDQAHFIKLFKSVTSLTPSQYSAFALTKQIDTSSPNFITEG